MYLEWRERGVVEATEQRVCDQARAIRKNGWLNGLELKEIRRNIRDKNELDETEDEEIIQSDIKKIQSEISILQREEKGELRTDSK